MQTTRDKLEWLFVLTLATFAISAIVGALPPPVKPDMCDFYVCPNGKISWPEGGGVLFEGFEKKDCILAGRGTKKRGDDFVTDHAGEHVVLDCKRPK